MPPYGFKIKAFCRQRSGSFSKSVRNDIFLLQKNEIINMYYNNMPLQNQPRRYYTRRRFAVVLLSIIICVVDMR